MQSHLDSDASPPEGVQPADQFDPQRALLAGADNLMFAVDRRYTCTAFSLGFERMLQAAGCAPLQVGCCLLDEMPERSQRQLLRRCLDRALAGEALVETLAWGDLPWQLQARFRPLVDSVGVVSGVGVYLTALPGQASDSLFDCERDLRRTLDATPALLWSALPDGALTYVNQAVLDYTGLSFEQTLAGDFAQAAHPEDRAALWQAWLAALHAGSSVEVQQRIRRHDGGYRWFLTRAWPERDAAGQVLKWNGIHLDIHDFKAAETALRESEERFNRAFRSSPVGIYIFELNSGRCRDVNQALLDMLGYTHAELVGSSADELDLFDDGAAGPGYLPRLLAEGELSQVETFLRTKSGELCYGLASITTFEMGGERLGMLININITRRKRAEEALQVTLAQLKSAHARLHLANSELEQRVAGRTAELQATNQALEKALRARDEFLNAVSHELRTPLNGILGLAEALQHNIYGSLTPRQMRAVQHIETSGQRLLDVVSDLLYYAQLRSGLFELKPETCALTDHCRACLEAVRPLAAARRQQLVFLIEPEAILLKADGDGLHQILLNMLENAIKFTPEDGRVELAVRGMADTQQVKISVTDTGIGIQEEDFPRLFQPFVQLDARLARMYEGVGLGLALVRVLVELHGGQVEVVSALGKGSCFTVYLPWEPGPG